MVSYHLINAQIKAGVWQGDLIGMGATQPQLQVTHLGSPLEDVSCHYDGTHDTWHIAVPIPHALINDGIQTFVISDHDGDTITQFTIIAGAPLADDLRAEVALLRGELELLKKAFRAQSKVT